MAKNTQGDLLSQAKLSSQARRINTRIQSIADIFGTESETYKKAISILIGDSYSDLVHVKTKGKNKGVIAITQSGKELSTRKGKNMLRGLEMSVKTFSEYKEKVLKDYPNIKQGLTNEELKQQIVDITETESQVVNEFTATRDAFYQAYTESEQKELLPNMFNGNGKPDWDTLNGWKEEMKKFVDMKDSEYIANLLGQ